MPTQPTGIQYNRNGAPAFICCISLHLVELFTEAIDNVTGWVVGGSGAVSALELKGLTRDVMIV